MRVYGASVAGGRMSAGDFFANRFLRVWPAHRWQHGRAADDVPAAEAEGRWLLVEWRGDGTVKYALSNLPPEATLEEAVALWKARWQVERGYQQLKGELGLDDFEGRSWAGFHHHYPDNHLTAAAVAPPRGLIVYSLAYAHSFLTQDLNHLEV